jgi:hypothetical protein
MTGGGRNSALRMKMKPLAVALTAAALAATVLGGCNTGIGGTAEPPPIASSPVPSDLRGASTGDQQPEGGQQQPEGGSGANAPANPGG